MSDELDLLRPQLLIPVGKLAISQFLGFNKLDEVIGRTFQFRRARRTLDVIPLPHPSGASPWHRMQPGKTLLEKALKLINTHPAMVTGRRCPSTD